MNAILNLICNLIDIFARNLPLVEEPPFKEAVVFVPEFVKERGFLATLFGKDASGGVRRWSTWSTWSACTAKCVQVRRRVCRTQSLEYYDKALVKHHQVMDDGDGQDQGPDQSSFGCHGKDMQSIVCRGGDCEIDETGECVGEVAGDVFS
ncbi:hypothetical protein pipiens_008951 [Culex pipiens pipiens]|uniref:Uncharacterized protein n=1 Tax=Culex pipiens pipiens TaxID=38569 RepID=A0ABD1DFW4_CULPP